MRITNVAFGAFKSLYDVSCDFSPFTVITGPNGAGKSNLADGINFVAEAYRNGLEMAVAGAGGYDSIAHRRTSRARTPISIGLEIELSQQEIDRYSHVPRQGAARVRSARRGISYPLNFRHRFSFRARGQALTSDFSIEEDVMEVADQDGILLQVSRVEDGEEVGFAVELDDRVRKLGDQVERLFYPIIDEQFQRLRRRPLANTDLLFASLSLYTGLFSIVRRQLHGSVFQLSPQQARKPGAPTPNASLKRYGENLPAVVHYLRKHRGDAWARIEDAMRAVVPNLIEIETRHTEDRSLALQFRERGVRRAWSTNEMSDGAIQALALFTAVLDGRSPFLLIEEPENSLHPWVLRRFLDLCREDSQSQIVLTTHSPVAIDYTPTESLRLMWQRRGRSAYQRWTALNPLVVEAWKRGDVRAFEAYDSGLFHEAVPPGFLTDDDDQLERGDSGMNDVAGRP